MKKLIILLFPFYGLGQDLSIGSWNSYQSYQSASCITETTDRIYCIASEGVFFVNKNDESISRLSKINGLSDFGAKQINYSKLSETVIITYKNCNIDLIKNNRVVNISDIKRKEILGNKLIYNVTIKENIAYLSSSFGLILVDLDKEEIKETYQLIVENNTTEIKDCAFKADTILVSTPDGVYFADANSSSLVDYNNWFLYDSTASNNIIASETTVLIEEDESVITASFCNGVFIKTKSDSILFYDSNLKPLYFLTHELIVDAQYSCYDDEENLWVADSENGLLKFEGLNYSNSFVPESPISNELFSLEYFSPNLYLCHGGHTNFGNWNNKDGASKLDKNGFWTNYNYSDLGNAKDIVDVTVINENIFFSSFYNGVSQMKNDSLVVRWNASGTNYAIDTIGDWANDKRLSVCGLKTDNEGNLWGVTSSVQNPLFVKTPDDNWRSFYIQQQIKYLYTDLIIDDNNQKWLVIGRDCGANEIGLLVYNDNNTIMDDSDDQYKLLNTSTGNGALPSLNILSIAKDLDGAVWIGTDKGVAVFYNPSLIFSGYNFDSEQILIQEGEYGQYLLSEEKVNCILVDGANRKWIGTEGSGLFLFSSDGTKEFLHFTSKNSPLITNNIVDLAMNPISGELFIGTSKGLMSFRSDATTGALVASKTKVFPNPVKETYLGPIAISGLTTNANFKITDITGNIVFEGYANGGQAIWNGKNKNNERVGTGVYLLFSTDEKGKEKTISKIMFIK